MKEFNYYQPTDIKFGLGRIREIGHIVSEWGKRCLLVTRPISPVFDGMIQKVKLSLKENGMAVAHFDGVIPNPTTAVVSDGVLMARSHNADVVIGLGGGSSMDTAKAIAVEATHDGTCWDYLFFRDTQPTEKTLPVIAITTTSGTGSHVTQVAVVTNPAEKNKSALYHPRLYPKVSIIDPELMLSVPKHITACTGFDVFAHAFESFIHANGTPYTDLMSLEAIRLVAALLPKAVKNGKHLEARTGLAWADTLAGLCIANAGVTLPHGIGMAIGGNHPHVKHGEALVVVYPAILRYTHREASYKFARIAGIFNPSAKNLPHDKASARFPDIMEDFLKEIGMSIGFEDLKIRKEELHALAEASLVLPDYKNHPRVANLEEIYELLRKSL